MKSEMGQGWGSDDDEDDWAMVLGRGYKGSRNKGNGQRVEVSPFEMDPRHEKMEVRNA